MNNYKTAIANFLTANLQKDLSVENTIKLFFSIISSSILVIVSLTFTYIAMSNGFYVLSYALLALISIHIFNYILLLTYKNVLLHRYINFMSIFLILIFILFKPGPNGLAYLWFYSFPVIVILLLDFKHGAYANTLFIIFLSFSFIYLNKYLPIEYTYGLKIRFLISYITISTLVFTFAYLAKRIEINYKKQFFKDIDLLNSRKEFISILTTQVKDYSEEISNFNKKSSSLEMTSKQQEYISNLHLSSENLIYLLNNILEISAFINNESDNLQKFNIITVIRNTISLFLSKNHDIELKYKDEFDTVYYGNPIQLKRILYNIIDSIIRVNNKNNSKIVISLKNHNNTSSNILFDIEFGCDEPILLTQSKESIIKHFSLEPTQKLIYGINGDFNVKQNKNHRLSFTFTCNFTKNVLNTDYKDKFEKLLFESQSSESTIKLNKFDIEQLKKTSVLLISEKISNQGEIKVKLTDYVKEINVTTNWIETLSSFSKKNYNFILLDMDSSNNPLNIAKKIKSYESSLGYKTIIIAINIDNISSNLHKIIESGIDEYVYKPFDLLSLINKLKIHFSKI